MKSSFMKLSLVFGLLLVAAALAGCGSQAMAQTEEAPAAPTAASEAGIIAEGRLEPAEKVRLGFTRLGQVAEVLVKEGQAVEKGALLAQLDGHEEAGAALKAAELERLNARQAFNDLVEKAGLAGGQARSELVAARQAAVEAEQRLDDLDNDDYQQQMDDAWVEVQNAKTELDDAQEEFDKYEDLDNENSQRTNAEDALEEAQKKYDDALRTHDRLKYDLELAQAEAARARAAVEDALREYESLKDGPAADDLELAQARVDNAEAQVAAAQAALDDLSLTAPFSGIVTLVEVSAGEQVSPGQTLFEIADFSTWYVETTDLTELEVVKIDPEAPVTLLPDALPGVELTGSIEHISDNFVEKSGDVLYTVRIRVDRVDPMLRWGMTVETRFGKK